MKRTFIVGGNYRGGTTATVALMESANIYMGAYGDRGNKEDFWFQELLHFKYGEGKISKDEMRELIKKRFDFIGSIHKSWGFKYPGVHQYIEDFIDLVDSPHVIYIMRDPVSVALSESDRGGQSAQVARVMGRTMRYNQLMLEHARRLPAKVLLLSYERLLTEPESTINTLQVFCETPFDMKLAMSMINKKEKNILKYYLLPAFEQGERMWQTKTSSDEEE